MPSGVYVRTEYHGERISESLKGRTPWNTGLTKETDSRLLKMSKSLAGNGLGHTNYNTEKKGYFTKGHKVWSEGLTKETSPILLKAAEKISKLRKEKILSGELTPRPYTVGKMGTREDTQQYSRSSWEANLVRIFKLLNIDYEYETKRCRFNLDDVGILILDFYLPKYDIFIEVKGYLTDTARKKLQCFKQKFPELVKKVFVVDPDVYSILKSKYSDKVLTWEN